MENKIIVNKSKIEGKGLFASKDIKMGEKICSFKGKKISIPKLKKMYKLGKERVDDPFQISDSHYIILNKPFIYGNRSCSPNAGFRGVNTLFALHNIKKGTEITFDYSTTEWTDDKAWGINWMKLWKIPCKCKSKDCRKMIRQFPLLPPKVKENYKKVGAIPDFILRKLKQNNKA